MSNNQALIKSLSRQLPKIDVWGVCSVWNEQGPNKTNTSVPKRIDNNSCLKDVCGVWKSEENNESLAIQTCQTLQEQNDVCEKLVQESSKTGMFKGEKTLQTHQTRQTPENDNIHKENVVVNELAQQVSLCAIDWLHYIGHYNERAAIREYEGSLTRPEAEYNAYLETLREFMACEYAEILTIFDSVIQSKSS